MFAVEGISDVVWQALIAAAVTIILAWMQNRTRNSVISADRKADEAAANAAIKVTGVKKAIRRRTGGLKKAIAENTKETRVIKETTDATHTLVNSGSLVQLRLYAVAARRLATLTSNHDDVQAADEAERVYEVQKAKQGLVDGGLGG